jgi:hypothetical protein
MSLIDLTGIVETDGRITLVWIEDNHKSRATPTLVEQVRPWFRLFVVQNPSDLHELLNSVAADTVLPADIYIVDFRLCNYAKECQDTDHQGTGIHAPAAGLILGVLTALRFPTYPQCLIPYSVHPDEFTDVWALVSGFCPPSVEIHTGSIDKDTDLAQMLKAPGLPGYRQVLEDSAAGGMLHIPLDDYRRLSSMVEKASENSAGVSGEEQIYILSDNGVRKMKVGSLFFDTLFMDDFGTWVVPPDSVRAWLSRMPAKTDQVVLQARALTDFYWNLADTEASRLTYHYLKNFKQGIKDPQTAKPPEIRFPWLQQFDSQPSDQVVRLCILFALVRFHHRHLSRTFSEEKREVLNLLRNKGALDLRLRKIFGNEEYVELLRRKTSVADFLDEAFEDGPTRGDVAAELKKMLKGVQSIPRPQDEVRDLLEDSVAPREIDLVRFLNPFPDRWTTAKLSLDTSGKVGSGLAELQPFLDAKALLEGDSKSVTAAELEAARAYAREFIPNSNHWPDWLRDASKAGHSLGETATATNQ